ncbi:Mur ligase [Trichophaea hybrida]|nr:Mur ligase [Trichophaea hybrida]
MIDLGLKRISQLISPSTLRWKAIHVAGTNGKGSVCAYLASALHASGIRVGRFTSPHLINRWDCIMLSNRTVSKSTFLAVEEKVLEKNKRLEIGATEFELLTATAFELFTIGGVEVGVVEVGLGGRGDATNVLEEANTLVSVITKLGLDHQGFLGDTIEEIAGEKAGIAKHGVPIVVDGSNPASVIDVVKRVVAEVGVGEVVLAAPDMTGGGEVGCEIATPTFGKLHFSRFLPGGYQPYNLSCAINALSLIAPRFPTLTPASIVAGIADTKWPGRLEQLDITALLPSGGGGGGGRGEGGDTVLVDGAHNPQAQQELRAYVDAHIRPLAKAGKVYWVLAATKGKDVPGMIRELVGDGDAIVATRFGGVDGMPWVQSVEAEKIVDAAEGREAKGMEGCVEAVRDAIERANQDGGAVVVAGSLWVPSHGIWDEAD